MLLPDLISKRSTRNKTFWILIIAGALLAFLAARPAYRVFKKYRAAQIENQAEKLIARGEWELSWQKIQAAWQLQPGRDRTVRIIAHILAHFRMGEAFGFWSQVRLSGHLTEAEEQEAIDLALSLNRLDIAESYLKEALRQTPVPPGLFRSAARFAAAKGNTGRAVEFVRAALVANPADPEMNFLLARLLLAGSNPSEVSEGKALLLDQAGKRLPHSAAAIETLLAQPQVSRAELETCLKFTDSLPGEKIDREILAAELRLRLQPARRAEIISATVDRLKGGPTSAVAKLCRWLAQEGETARVLEIVPASAASRDREIFLVFVDALAGLGRWKELETFLAPAQSPVEPFFLELYRARVAAALKKDRQADLHWAQAQWLAAKNPETLSYLAEYAEKSGETAQAMTAYKQMTRNPKTATAAYYSLIRLMETKGSTGELLDLMKELAALNPNDPRTQNDLAYLQLLRRENVAGARDVALKLVTRYPSLASYRVTLALASLRQNDPTGARAAFGNVLFDSDSALPGWRAVYAAALGANGEEKLAREMAASIPIAALKPEERELIKPWRP